MSAADGSARILAAAPLFAALGDPTRLGLLLRLGAEGPLSITALSRDAAVSRQAITKHLEALAGAGLASSFRRGRERLWRFEPGRLEEARLQLDRLSRQWDEALGRLKLFVEE